MTAKRCYNTTEAMAYLGIRRRSFETHILPRLIGKGVRIGNCVVYEVRDLDAAWESYKMEQGGERSGQATGENVWDATRQPASTRRRTAMTSTAATTANAFDGAASRLTRMLKSG